jgi:hypothetical protein
MHEIEVNYVQERQKFDHNLYNVIHSQIVGVTYPLCTLLPLSMGILHSERMLIPG